MGIEQLIEALLEEIRLRAKDTQRSDAKYYQAWLHDYTIAQSNKNNPLDLLGVVARAYRQQDEMFEMGQDLRRQLRELERTAPGTPHAGEA